ncbi:hypothetical protein ABH15_11105 [Methanoculleus taiwanensis]|uniref:Uncharacterized protein n=1 Tax=Methanoculleus taiwanensis TaxID=1550565 RepID=A0A498GWS2_9EURY|nr:hypothetical protein ABH15_11105 [Methanoculleus taiwanensis]
MPAKQGRDIVQLRFRDPGIAAPLTPARPDDVPERNAMPFEYGNLSGVWKIAGIPKRSAIMRQNWFCRCR